MPHSVEMPAPVKGTILSACSIRSAQFGDDGGEVGCDHYYIYI